MNTGVRKLGNTCVRKIAYKDVTTTENTGVKKIAVTGVRKIAENGLGK